MKYIFILLTLFASIAAAGQQRFDSLKLERSLMTLPDRPAKTAASNDVLKAIEVVDNNYRRIADSLYGYRSLEHTIFQTLVIKIDDSVYVDPFSLGGKIQLKHIVFYNSTLNIKLQVAAKKLDKNEQQKMYHYLSTRFDHFSKEKKKLMSQPVTLVYIKFPDSRHVHIGIDIYGAHFLWTADKLDNWKIIKTEQLWIY